MDRPEPGSQPRSGSPARAVRPYDGFHGLRIPLVIRVGTGLLTLARLSELQEGDLVLLDRPVGAPFDLLSGEVLLGKVEPVASDLGVAVKLVQAADPDDEDAPA